MLGMKETEITIPPFKLKHSASKAEKASLIITLVCIFVGAGLYIYGEQATGIGAAGVVNKLLGSLGMAVFSVGLLIVGVLFAKWIISGLGAMSTDDRSETLKALGKQLLVVLLNIIVYGGCVFLFLGGIAALDYASAGVLIAVFGLWALCIAVFIFYRRYRKKHKMSYSLVGYVAMTLFFLGFATLLITAFFRSEAPNAFQDLAEGPTTADVFLVEADIDYPSYRYRAFVQDQHILTFYTADNERIVLRIPEKDVAAAQVINDYGNFVHVTYYPRSQVFCEATPWKEGPQAMGDELLNKLMEEYELEV